MVRILSATLEAAQKTLSTKRIHKVVLTSGATTKTYANTSILDIKHSESTYTQKATIVIDNSDNSLTALDLSGYNAVISYGATTSAGDEYSPCAPTKCVAMRFDSAPNLLECTMEFVGIPDQLDWDKADTVFIPSFDDVKTVKDLIKLLFSTPAVWEDATAYSFGDLVVPTVSNSFIYKLTGATTPAFRAAGAKAAGTGAVSPALPAGMSADDICILVAATDVGGTITITTTGSITEWTAITGSPIDVALGEKLYVWWGRYSSGSTAPTLTPAGDHCCAGIAAWSGCVKGGSPIEVAETGYEEASDKTLSFATTVSTTTNNCKIILCSSDGVDSNTPQHSAQANASLSSITERMDYNTSSGGGGGFQCVEGVKTLGALGTWTTTLANNSPKAYITFALRPAVNTSSSGTSGGAEPTWPLGIDTEVADNDIYWSNTGLELTSYQDCPNYTVTFDSVDSLIISHIPSDSFRVYLGDTRKATLIKLLNYTNCVARFEDDGEIHILQPTTTGASYDYQYALSGQHTFLANTKRKRLVIPNKIVVQSRYFETDQFSGTATDATSYTALGYYITDTYRTRVTRNAEAQSIAEALMLKLQTEAESGALNVPLNVGAELWDYCLVTDARMSSATRTGNIGTLNRNIHYDKRSNRITVYNMSFSFGGWLNTQGLLNDIISSSNTGGNISLLPTVDDQDAFTSLAYGVFPGGTVTEFQGTAATGTMTNPDNINDNNITGTSFSVANAIGKYAEVNLGATYKLRRVRHVGDNNNNADGFWKIQYFSAYTNSWKDWITSIPTTANIGWSGYIMGNWIITNKIRLVCTAVDTGAISSAIRELEVIW